MPRPKRWGRNAALAVAIWNTAGATAASGLAYAVLLTGSKGVNINAAAADPQGNVYVVGTTQSSDFPVTPNALKTQIDANGDAFVTKFSPTGQLLWSTFVGGMYGASANAVAVDGAGNVVVAGDTYSPDFPVVNTYEPVFNNGVTEPVGQQDAFVFKLDPTLTEILYSTFLGSFTSGTSMALDSSGAAYVTGTLNAHDPQPLAATATVPIVTVGGMQVPVISSVMTTGTVGLYQIAIQRPTNVPTGTPAIQASINGASTQSGVTLFVGAQ
ncbi:MAG TPA: SBBP repeat-containing protein [Bryobacteraceae bacterium]|nr:SBBP repeat-containing protein [Bryobacteraceae bacterium]